MVLRRLLLTFIICLVSCQSQKKEKGNPSITEIHQESIQKIDVHAHYKYKRDYLPTFFKEWNMQGVLVDVSIADSVTISRSWKEYLAHAKAQPELFYLCSSLIGVGIDDADFVQKTIRRLKQEVLSGARMVKVWKNFGMVTKDATGQFIQIDDVRLQPIWDFLKEKGIPVMAHIGEPVQAWRPLDDPNNPHYGYYKNNPQYHAYQHSEIPSYETIITARDRWMAANPDLKILCAHLGSMSHDVDMVAQRLDRFPNIYVEPAARFGDLVGQNSDKVSAFFKKYQDRIMFGTDYGTSRPQSEMTVDELKAEKQNLDEGYQRLWTYIATKDSVFERGQRNIGLGLPKEVLDKFYYRNAVDFLKLDTP